MALTCCLVYLAVIGLTGYALCSAILGSQRRSIAETAGLVLLLGAGGTGCVLLGISLLEIPPARATIVLLGLVDILAIVLLGWRGRISCPVLPAGKSSPLQIVLIVVLVLALAAANLVALVPALGYPLFSWDAFVIWGLKAKVLYFSALTPRPDYFTDVRFSYSHLDYPLLLPMLTAGAYTMMGTVNDQLGKIVLPALFAGQTLLAYTGARLWLGRAEALLVALLMIGAPFNVLFAGMGNADMALTTFRLGAIVYLVRWIGQPQRSDIVLAALFSFFAAMTKSEGLALALIDGLIVLIFAARAGAWKDLGIFALLLGIGLGIWLIWRTGIPHTDENYVSRLSLSNISQGAGRIGLILQTMVKRCMGDMATWGAIWVLLPLMLIIGLRALARREAQALWMLLLLHAGLYVMIYMIAPWDLNELLPATIERLTLHMLPTAMLLIAIHWQSTLPPGNLPTQEYPDTTGP